MQVNALCPLLVLAVLLGCRGGSHQKEPAGPLSGVLVVHSDGTATGRVLAGDAITLVLRVRNSGGEVWRHTFPTSQQHDFRVVDRPSGGIVWTWSDDMGFLTMLTEREIAPGEEIEFTVDWQPQSAGEYEIRGYFPPDEVRALMTLIVER